MAHAPARATEWESCGIGAPMPRIEDERLLTGRGRYADDVALPNMAFAYVVRSPHAHARILRIDTAAALTAPGVLAVLTGEDVARDKLGHLKCGTFPKTRTGASSYCPTQPVLVADKARHVGDRIALVVAESVAQAKDAAELIDIRYEPLPALTLVDALAPDATKIWDAAASNLSFQIEFGDRAAVDIAFAAAPHVTKVTVHYPRASANSLEPRAAIAFYDPADDRYTLCSATQNPFRVRDTVAEILAIAQSSLRVRAMDVGGSFGMKGQVYPEEVLVVWAAAKLRRPVKWTADRSEALASDMHGRHQIAEAELALDRDGRMLAFRTNVTIDVGAYLGISGGVPPHNAGVSYPGTYRLPVVHTTVRAAFTNSSQLGPYRGSAKPEASFVLERLVEKAARELGIDAIDLRRRNLIDQADLPYKTVGGDSYDCGDFALMLDTAMKLADWRSFMQRQAANERHDRRRGIGLAMHCQRAGGSSERMEIRFAADGGVSLYVGTLATGQGHETMFAQMVSDWLGVRTDKVRVFQGDTDKVIFGRGSFAQRSMSAGGSALKRAAEDVIEKGRRLAAWVFEAAAEDVVFDRAAFRVIGTDRMIGWSDLARRSYLGGDVPAEFGIGLAGTGTHEGPNTFPNGCFICEVAVDLESGVIMVERLYAVDDVGAAVNPLTLEGQLHGSVAHGLGEALMEAVVYERGSGQLLTGSFMDYAMPRADVMPDIVSESVGVPTRTNLLGVKGGSEAGNVGMPAAIINAVMNALAPLGVTEIALPATPENVWRAIRAAKATS
jgi:carbon-monoxide dehydrogenase large subunit